MIRFWWKLIYNIFIVYLHQYKAKVKIKFYENGGPSPSPSFKKGYILYLYLKNKQI